MKLSLIITLITSMSVSASMFSQDVKLNLTVNNMKVKEVLKLLETKTSYRFFYSDDFSALNKVISVNAVNNSIDAILEKIFDETSATYKILENNIVVISPFSSLQTIKITGKITDISTGEPLVGVNIIIEGTTTGVTSNNDGNYSIEVPNGNTVLVFSYVGYLPEKVTVGNNSTINVTLMPDIQKLGEVVVVGYGTQKRVNLTGSITAINGDNVAQKPATQLSAALQGMAPGVTVTQSTGQPGLDNGTIRIRGIGTLNNNNPLVLIDNVESDINSIDVNDIESISILKDAASTSIYGVRAANGVILITTKRGTKEKTKVTYAGYVGVQNPTKLPDYVGAQDFMKLVNLARTNSGAGALYSDADIAAYNDPNRDKNLYPDVNWVNEVLKGSGFQQEHSIAVSGGTEKSMYRFSANYFEQEGLIRKTNYDRLTLRLNSDLEINKHLTFSADMSGKFSTRTEPQKGMWFQFGQAIVSNPLIPVKYANGDYSVDRGDGNPVRLQYEGGKNNYNDNLLTGNFKAVYKIFDGLSLTGSVNGTYTTDYINTYNQALVYNLPSGGTVTKDNNSLTDESYRNWFMNYQGLMNYAKTFGNNSVAVLGGISKITSKTNDLTGYRNNGSLGDLPQLNAGDPSSQTNNGYLDDYALLSYFGRINYAFMDKYLLEANVRRDASSRFMNGKRWGTFPSFSAGWRISKESFMNNISFIKELKIRGSWGRLGNQEVLNSDGTVNNYPYQSLIYLGSDYPFGGNLQSGARMRTYPNSDISWETTQMSNVGIDGSVLNGQLDFSFDYYVKKTSDILLTLPIPMTVGLGASVQNAGAVENKGWEFTLGYRGKVGSDFNYGVRFNLADVHNKITDMKDGDYLSQNNDNIIWAYYKDHPIGAYYGYVSEGIIRTDAQATNHVTQFGSPVEKGDLGYADLSGIDLTPDNSVTSADRTFIGSNIPRYTYSFNLNTSFKNFDFMAFFQGVGKVDINTLQFDKAPRSSDGNFKEFHKDNWRPDNVGASFPRLLTSTQNYVSSSFWIKSGAYLRLKNIQLGYTLPNKITQKLKLAKCRIYIAGQNLITWSPLNDSGIDPENPTDNRYYPQVKTFTTGINVEF